MKFTLCKKQYIYLALAVISLALALTTRVFAQEMAPTENGSGAEQVESRLTDENTQAGERRSGLKLAVQDRIVNLSQNVTGKMRAAVNRMEQIIGRIDARTTLLKGQNIDTVAIESSVQSAKNSLAFAKNKLPLIDAFVIEQVSSENPAESFKNIKSEFAAIRDAIRNTHNILIFTVSLLKEAADKSGDTTDMQQSDDTATSSTDSSN